MSLDIYLYAVRRTQIFEANITHNLGEMADEAGLYKALWAPEDLGITRTGGLIPKLTRGLATLKEDPEHFKKFNPENGYGNYENLVCFVEKYLEACKENPDAEIKVSR